MKVLQSAAALEQLHPNCMVFLVTLFCLCTTLQLTLRIFVAQSDIFSLVTVNTFGADVSPHTSLIHSDL